MGHVKDRWTRPGGNGRRVHNDRWGKGRRWQARWTDRAGREHALTFSTKDAADAHLRRAETGIHVQNGQRLTFRAYAESWLESQLHHREQTAESTARKFRTMLLPQLGGMMLDEVERGDVQRAVGVWAKTYAPSTVEIAYGYVATLYKHAIQDRLVSFSPCVRISLPEDPKTRMRPLRTEQVLAIRANMTARYKHAVEVVAGTGLRGGEFRGLTLDRIDMDTGLITIDRQLIRSATGTCEPVFGPPKTDAGYRTLEMSDPVHDAIKAQMEEYPVTNPWGLLFTNRMKHPVTRADAGDAWRNAVAGLGLPARSGWHALRHYCASLLIAQGLSPTAVADWLGHDDPAETLRTYSHLWHTDRTKILAALNAELGAVFQVSSD